MSPCYHQASITLNDGRKAAFGWAYEIKSIIAHIAKEKIHPIGSWNVEEIQTHFHQLRTSDPGLGWFTELPDVVLNRLFLITD